MKHISLGALLLLGTLPLFLNGCGGGGGGSSSVGPTNTPRPTSTPGASARILVVQLRDAAGGLVDGIITVGSSNVATSGGQATFRSVASGRVAVSAEVNGATTSGTATVAASGTTTFVLTIATQLTPSPTTTPPSAPF